MQLLLLLMVFPLVGGCPWVREQALCSSGMAGAQYEDVSQTQGWKAAQPLPALDRKNGIFDGVKYFCYFSPGTAKFQTSVSMEQCCSDYWPKRSKNALKFLYAAPKVKSKVKYPTLPTGLYSQSDEKMAYPRFYGDCGKILSVHKQNNKN